LVALGCTYSRFFDTNRRLQSFVFNKIGLAVRSPEKAGDDGLVAFMVITGISSLRHPLAGGYLSTIGAYAEIACIGP
jgi:hypothetical protein